MKHPRGDLSIPIVLERLAAGQRSAGLRAQECPLRRSKGIAVAKCTRETQGKPKALHRGQRFSSTVAQSGALRWRSCVLATVLWARTACPHADPSVKQGSKNKNTAAGVPYSRVVHIKHQIISSFQNACQSSWKLRKQIPGPPWTSTNTI